MTAQTILPANSVTGGFNVDNSLRFQSNDYLKIDPAGDGNLTTWTSSFWVKRAGAMGGGNIMWDAGTNGGNNYSPFFFQSNGTLRFYEVVGGTLQSFNFITNRVFLDPTAWYHFVYRVDTTQGTNTNRVRLYVNGVQETSFSTAAYPAEDYNTLKNDATFEMIIGSASDNKGNDMQGYMSEFVHIDGQSLAPTSFGEFDEDSGIWKPINVGGLTFGTNGFYLQFKETGTSQNSSGIGADTSGQDNHMAVSGLAAIDQSTDTCTNNFATANPLDSGFKVNLSEGNLKFVGETADYIQQWGRTTFGVSRGKWYWEMTKIANNPCIGIVTMQSPINLALENNTAARCVIYCSGQLDGQDNSGRVNGIATSIADYDDDDIVSCMMDLDNGFVYFAKNGTIQIGADDSTTGNPASGSSGTGAANPTSQLLTNQHDGVWSPLIYDNSSNPAATAIYNFGNPIVALSSGVADGNGFGSFEYAPPSGYYSLCTKNLAEYG